ncbi:TetR/AcrR family transcriptional regulator [Neisseria sp. MVDL19-042950]|uniref:TetR/AcrR family transcriptional regulator n=1 Tax=Neisseria sp. MVDL19-042950 TaxID=3061169 RepID=UPI0026601F70|nr:TetR/AcrR family transcriptional regulator [Neisseria sp. MVDL19-042950]MDO1508833.1 TetR/AcrR family transcriptional regulator [Neisseria sp. MVDL19-042950]
MTNSSRSQLIQAGLRLYPQYGYRKLSVRLLAAEAGLSAGMFHHAFADKNTFLMELLQEKYNRSFELVAFDSHTDIPAVKRLRESVWQLAVCLRDNLEWVHRVLADSADGAEVVDEFLRARFGRFSDGLLSLLNESSGGRLTLSEQILRLTYLNGSVFAPMIIGTRLNNMGVLPEPVSGKISEVLENAAIAQRIEWSFSVLFPHDKA